MGPLSQCLYDQVFTTPAYPTTDCTGRTIIVTGANTGLGKEAVRHLVRLNADRVILTAQAELTTCSTPTISTSTRTLIEEPGEQ